MWKNAHGFLSSGLINQVNRLIPDPRLNSEEKQGLLQLSTALTCLPTTDPDFSCEVEIDFSWDDLNWVGRLRFLEGEFTVWSTMHQLDGVRPELNAQWQHTALKLSCGKFGYQLAHDPAHLWLWIQCFRRFCDWWLSQSKGSKHPQGYMTLQSAFGSLVLDESLSEKPDDDNLEI
jgi:hypothetical protein